ncbi:hypothetical protein [Sphingomonas montanisoli]|uniref:Uncharacterized protein n=1 Tax=Sphingomonas montanisoli TaxID=2606412 RepID=A0A5D9CD80_9SPHN|nr:hypothetical protein [Sphingomonas montanisoli]TZG28065.1 hypothetical protein FYJ91_11110 [Sphingomonas montanisoli]
MDEAIAVLEAALARSDKGRQDGPDVRLALRVLRLCGIPADALRYFWESCQGEHEIGRWQNMNAALNGIRGLSRQPKG